MMIGVPMGDLASDRRTGVFDAALALSFLDLSSVQNQAVHTEAHLQTYAPGNARQRQALAERCERASSI
jgi:hypothetical protein